MLSNSESSQNLRQRTLAGLGWETLSRLGLQVIQFGISVILARLLTPNDYGLVGMAAVYVVLFQFVGELGLGGSIVQRKDVTAIQLNSIFWLNIPLAFVLGLLAFFLAPVVAAFFDNPDAGPLFVGAAISTLIMVPATVPRALIYKNMEFRKTFYFNVAGAMAGGIVGIGAAVFGFGAWSLIASSFAASLARNVIVWQLCNWRPQFVFTPRSLANLVPFSFFYLSDQILRQISRDLDYLLIGYFFLASDLGHYTLAFRLMDLPRSQINMVFLGVLYPVLIKLQDDRSQTNHMLFRILQGSTLLVFPILIGLGIVAYDFVPLLYGEKWAVSIPILQVLIFTGVFSCIDFIAPTVLLAQGRANFSFALSVVRASTLLVFIWLASPAGIVAVAAAVSAHAAIMLIISFALVHRLTQFGLVRMLKAISPAAAGSLVMILVTHFVRDYLVSRNASPLIVLLAQVAVGCLIYVAVIVVWPSEDIRSMVRSIQLRIGFLRDSKFVNGLILKWGNLGKRPVVR